jgi:hypothetical protein
MTRVPIEAMNGQGQSIEATVDKERCLGSALTMGMKIANAKFGGRGFPYWHCDANAGCGHNDICDVPGSPIVFHVAADACLIGMRRHAFFCDIDRAAFTELSSRLSAQWLASSYLLLGDNEDSVELFAERIRQSGDRPQYAVGSIIVDPNGYWYRNGNNEGPPIRSLLRFTAEFPRIDIILNLNARTYRLQRSKGHHVLPPREVFASLNKAHWLVRHTRHGSGNDWLLAVGRNVETGDHRKIGFHKLESVEGCEIMADVEGGRQRDLPI